MDGQRCLRIAYFLNCPSRRWGTWLSRCVTLVEMGGVMAETRRLAAILAADVVGFSRMTGADEDRTLARLRTLRSDLIDPTISVHNGHVFKRTGDGILIEFRSVVDAVRCAIEVQSGMVERNAGLPPERRIEFRVGIHLGDVVEESDGDLMGDGVNIAARLEGVAQPGAICLSEDAYRQVSGKLDMAVTDIGQTQLKNIERPIRVYSLQVGVPAQFKPATVARLPRKHRKIQAIIALAAVLTIAIGLGVGLYTLRSSGQKGSAKENLAAKPSIAVLPFANLSGDPAQDYFSDGVADEILTALSRSHELTVIGRHSSFTFKGNATSTEQVGKVLGVRYLLQGSVQKSSNQIRVTAQLIDSSNDAQIWGEKYDRPMQDIFAVQDDIVGAIAAHLTSSIKGAEIIASAHKRPDDLGAYDYYLRGQALYRTSGKQETLDSRGLFEKAIEIDPSFAPAYAQLAYTYYVSIALRWELPPRAEALAKAFQFAQKAATLDPALPFASTVMGDVLLRRGDFDQAVLWAQKAIDLDTNNPEAYAALANIFAFINRNDEAIPLLDKAMALDPLYPVLYSMYRGRALLFLQRPQEAAPFLRDCETRAPDYWICHILLASAYAHLGKKDMASTELAEVRRYYPVRSLAQFRREGDYQPGPQFGYFSEGLVKAGLPADNST